MFETIEKLPPELRLFASAVADAKEAWCVVSGEFSILWANKALSEAIASLGIGGTTDAIELSLEREILEACRDITGSEQPKFSGSSQFDIRKELIQGNSYYIVRLLDTVLPKPSSGGGAKFYIDHLGEGSDSVVLLLDGAGRITHITAAIASVSGFDPTNVIGLHFTEIFIEQDREHLLASFKSLLAGGGSTIFKDEEPCRLLFQISADTYFEASFSDAQNSPCFNSILLKLSDISSKVHYLSLYDNYSKRLRITTNISQFMLRSGGSLKELAEYACEEIANTIGDASLLALLREGTDYLDIIATTHRDKVIEAQYAPSIRKFAFPLHNSILGQATISRKTIFEPILTADEMLAMAYPNFDVYIRGVGISSLIVVPLYYQDKPLGALAIARNNESPRYQEAEKVLIEDIGYRLSLAIHNEQTVADHKRAKEESERANMLKSEFIANISHEIRTPLNSVIGFAELLSESVTDPSHRRFAHSILSSSKHLLVIINDILDVSKIEANKLDLHIETLDVGTFLEELRSMFEMKASKKGIDFAVQTSENFPGLLLTDTSRLRQVLMNLVGNAVKFTKQGNVKLTATVNALHESSKTADITFAVEDTGIGIAVDALHSIFEPFFQGVMGSLKNDGTGLGLYISQRLAAMLGGTIAVESEFGKGSTFSVRFPSMEVGVAAEQSIGDSAIAQPIRNFQGHSALLVDDMQSSREIVRRMLDGTNLAIHEAVDGEEALAAIKEHSPSIVLMDIIMPGQSGIEIGQVIKKSMPSPPTLVAVTVQPPPNEPPHGAHSCFADWITKPFTKETLLSAMERLLLPASTADKNSNEKDTRLFGSVMGNENITPQLVSSLEENFLAVWRTLLPIADTEEIERFASRLSVLARQNNASALLLYANLLAEQARFLDFENLPDTIKEFPAIIELYKEALRLKQ